MTRYASWGIIIDDIIFPDGRSAMGVPGGAGLYAVLGMRVWTPEVTLIASVDNTFDAQAITDLGLDSGGLHESSLPTPRAWQLFEEDGHRTQIFRVPGDVVFEQLARAPLKLPFPESVEAVHYMYRGHAQEEAMLQALIARPPNERPLRLSLEPIVDAQTTAAERELLLRYMPHVELFSPDEEGAALLVGALPPLQQLRALAGLGPRVVCLRQGAAGSLVYERETGRAWRAPAAPANVVDVTGAGNAYCGGFLVGWHEGLGVRQAAAQAAVSAALALEQIGPPSVNDAKMAEARRRAAQLLPHIRPAEEEEEEKT